ncbi:MAG: hypothetical protein WKG00_30430 [Polyangiaceae bacterium]
MRSDAGRLTTLAVAAVALAAAACGGDGGSAVTPSGAGSSAGGSGAGASGGGPSAAAGGEGGRSATGPLPEEQPAPAEGSGVADPLTNSLHDHGAPVSTGSASTAGCSSPRGPEVGPVEEMDRCVDRYAGWVTHAADGGGLARVGVCGAGRDRTVRRGRRLRRRRAAAEALCGLVHPELDGAACVEQMAELRSFGIQTVADVLALAADEHHRDVPLMAALLGHGSVACGGADRWKLQAPEGFLDRYVAAYNAYKARSSSPPQCKKRIVVSVALYTGIDDPGADGVAAANGCWTYERISKPNSEWKICNYDGTVHHQDGTRWVYDDTNTAHDASTDKSRINACKQGVPGRGYVYMTNRGSGWPKRVTEGVEVHFAEIYSGQYTVADQLGTWKSGGKPGEPMVNFGEPSTSASVIGDVTAEVCATVGDGGYFGVYVYPESLRGGRMSAMVEALNGCTGK